MPLPIFSLNLVVQAARTPDNGMLIGDVYFTHQEAEELLVLMGHPNGPMPQDFGIEYLIDQNAFELRAFLSGPHAPHIEREALGLHPEIPTSSHDPRPQPLADVYGKLREVVRRSIG